MVVRHVDEVNDGTVVIARSFPFKRPNMRKEKLRNVPHILDPGILQYQLSVVVNKTVGKGVEVSIASFLKKDRMRPIY
jgi:hypothetical protein